MIVVLSFSSVSGANVGREAVPACLSIGSTSAEMRIPAARECVKAMAISTRRDYMSSLLPLISHRTILYVLPIPVWTTNSVLWQRTRKMSRQITTPGVLAKVWVSQRARLRDMFCLVRLGLFLSSPHPTVQLLHVPRLPPAGGWGFVTLVVADRKWSATRPETGLL